jgi:D-proline reductase (dithiol) PrdB
VGLVARKIEEAGIPTVTLNMIWVYQNVVGMPRVAAIEHPFGRPFGDVGDAQRQRAVLCAMLEMAEQAQTPGQITHLPFLWHEDPQQTKWHPAEPSPIMAMIKARQAKKAAIRTSLPSSKSSSPGS